MVWDGLAPNDIVAEAPRDGLKVVRARALSAACFVRAFPMSFVDGKGMVV